MIVQNLDDFVILKVHLLRTSFRDIYSGVIVQITIISVSINMVLNVVHH